MIFSIAFAVALVLTTTFLHYEALNFASRRVRGPHPHPRMVVLGVVLLLSVAHVAEVMVYAIAFYLDSAALHLNVAADEAAQTFWTYFYFSIETFTSLGFGDIVPKGDLRFLAGVETLNGLLLIGWSGSFIFLVMQKLWRFDNGGR